jgi:hypothetical protein
VSKRRGAMYVTPSFSVTTPARICFESLFITFSLVSGTKRCSWVGLWFGCSCKKKVGIGDHPVCSEASRGMPILYDSRYLRIPGMDAIILSPGRMRLRRVLGTAIAPRFGRSGSYAALCEVPPCVIPNCATAHRPRQSSSVPAKPPKRSVGPQK